MTQYDIPAPAKLNLFLHVLGRRADGYHRLQTVFRFIDFSDVLHIETRADGCITRAGGLPEVAPEDDLVVRAARALQAATGTRLGAHIELDKHIPAGGGLGGGSSDAASTLLALNRLWGTGLSRAELLRLALPLGADVPVFVFGANAFAEGVGEELSAIDLPARSYLVMRPAAQVASAAVFAAPELTRDTPACTVADFLSASLAGFPFGRNDLEAVARARFPAVERAFQVASGAGLAARLSGSGACLFAEFPAAQQAVLAQNQIAVTMRVADPDAQRSRGPSEAAAIVWMRVCDGLAEHPLRHWVTDSLGSRQVG